jgi:predicted DNA binding protein
MRNSKFTLDTDDNDTKDSINKEDLARFAQGAQIHNVISNSEEWRNAYKDSAPSYNMRLTFNQYQIGLLRYVAKQEKRSLSNLLKLILFEKLEQMNIQINQKEVK